MIERALLQIARPAGMLDRLGGMSLIERQLWTLRRAGFRSVTVGAAKPVAAPRLRLPEGLRIVWSPQEPRVCESPVIALSGEHLIRVEVLQQIASAPHAASVALEDSAGRTVLQVLLDSKDRVHNLQRQQLTNNSSCAVSLPSVRSEALRWLLSLGTKPQEDGFMARHFDRHISLAASRLLLDTPVTPNMMTVASSLLGLAGAALFVVPDHGWRLGGALFVWLHSVLDGCDGELARIRFQESSLGADLDFWGDNIVHVALFACIAAGFYRADRDVWPIIAAVAASIGTLGSALLNYRERLERRLHPASAAVATHAESIVPALTRLENILVARDFIYLLVLLACVDRLYEFMWAAAIGSLLFLSLMLFLGGKNEQVSQPDSSRKGQVRDSATRDGGRHQHIYSRN